MPAPDLVKRLVERLRPGSQGIPRRRPTGENLDAARTGPTRRKGIMKPVAGLWIDHRRAVVVVVTDKGEETRTIESHAEKHVQRAAGSRHGGRFESQAVLADDSHQREYTGELDRYYDRVAAHVRGAEAVLIFGPGEAKGELKKRIRRDPAGGRIVGVEAADKMTVSQIVAKVRQQFTELENPGETRRKSR
jgi:hypothetical protein